MNRDLILRKLETLRRCLERIRGRIPGSAEALQHDYDAQDIISLNLERAVQTCVDLGAHLIADSELPAPPTMAETFPVLSALNIIPEDLSGKLRKTVGFRNISVHEYDAIDWSIVYSIVTKDLDIFREFARQVLERTEKDSPRKR